MIGCMGFWSNGNLTEPTVDWLLESSQKFYPKHAAILDLKIFNLFGVRIIQHFKSVDCDCFKKARLFIKKILRANW